MPPRPKIRMFSGGAVFFLNIEIVGHEEFIQYDRLTISKSGTHMIGQPGNRSQAGMSLMVAVSVGKLLPGVKLL